MMGRQTVDQSQLFYLFNIERRIPERHLLRRINPTRSSAETLAARREGKHPKHDLRRAAISLGSGARQRSTQAETLLPVVAPSIYTVPSCHSGAERGRRRSSSDDLAACMHEFRGCHSAAPGISGARAIVCGRGSIPCECMPPSVTILGQGFVPEDQ